MKPVNPQTLQRIRQDIQSMHAYAVQESAGMIKLDAMENPHRLSLPLQTALGMRLGALALNRYPGERINVLRRALAVYAKMPTGFDIMLGNGSDELISLLALACDVPGASILAPLPGFVMYAMSAQLQGLAFHGVPLSAEFELDEDGEAVEVASAEFDPDRDGAAVNVASAEFVADMDGAAEELGKGDSDAALDAEPVGEPVAESVGYDGCALGLGVAGAE